MLIPIDHKFHSMVAAQYFQTIHSFVQSLWQHQILI